MLQFVARLRSADPAQRALLPSRRTIEASCGDLGITYHAFWANGALSDPVLGPAPRANIRISVGSDVLIGLASGDIRFSDAWLNGKLRLEASMTDMLRLRAAL